MLTAILDGLNQYVNILLTIITGVYAYLTWRMLREMRSARENQSDASLVVLPVPLSAIHAKLIIMNAGPGPAFDIEASWELRPLGNTPSRSWRHPAMVANQTEHFLFPGEKIPSLRELADEHEVLVVKVSWRNSFGRAKSTIREFDLRRLAEGWYNAGHLILPDELLGQVKKIEEELEKINKNIYNVKRSLDKKSEMSTQSCECPDVVSE
jgi:hypothetical protein